MSAGFRKQKTSIRKNAGFLFGAGYGSRTRLHSLGSCCITDIRTLHGEGIIADLFGKFKYYFVGDDISRFAPRKRRTNGELVFERLRLKVSCHCEPVRRLVWQSPGPMEQGNDYHQKSQWFTRFLELFETFPLYPGDCHDQCAHWSRNDSFFSNTILSAWGIACGSRGREG